MKHALILVLSLGGCIAMTESPCDPDLCAGSFGCHAEGYCVEDRCSDDGECKSGYICEFGSCDPLCDEDDCDGGFACNHGTNRCYETCFDDDACAEGRECCTSDRVGEGRCTSEKRYECVKE